MTEKIITLTLTARTGFHLGGGGGDDVTDSLVRRDGKGNPIIPGTALAGAFRTLLTRIGPRLSLEDNRACLALFPEANTDGGKICGCPVCRMMGDVRPLDEAVSQNAQTGAEIPKRANASRLLVGNGEPEEKAIRTVIRDGIGMDRVTGAAARSSHAKFDLELVPAGTKFISRWQLRNKTPEDMVLLAAGLSEWQAGRAWLGGNVGRGLGAFDVKIQAADLDLSDSASLVEYLKSDDPWEIAQDKTAEFFKPLEKISVVSLDKMPEETRPFVASRWLRFEMITSFDGPMLTNDTLVSALSGFDHAPLLARMDRWQNPVLAGSSIRGVIRSHAERIARTIATHAVSDESGFLRACPACSPVQYDENGPLACCDTLLSKNRVLSEDQEAEDRHLCLGCRLFGSTRRGSRFLVEDASFDSEAAGGGPELKVFDFLAVDRFTGGGAEHLKFDALALWNPVFKIRMFLENPRPWEIGWLALVLRDMKDKHLGLGMGGAMGFGWAKLEKLDCTLGYLDDSDIDGWNPVPSGARNGGLYRETAFDPLRDNRFFLERFHQEIQKFRRGEGTDKDRLPNLAGDSYFGKVSELYAREMLS